MPHRVGRNVRDIHEHAETVHLPDNALAKRRQAIVPGDIGSRVSPVERVGVRQRHIAGAQRVQSPQHAERIVDGMPAFDTDQRRDLAFLADAHNIVGRVRHRERVGVRLDEPMNHVNLFQRLLDGGLFLDAGGIDVGGPELRPDAAFPQPFDVGMQQGLRFREVHPVERKIRPGPILPGEVVVAIEEQGFAMNLERLVRQLDDAAPGGLLLSGSRRRRDECANNRCENREMFHGGSW